jgi:IS5 family transposase
MCAMRGRALGRRLRAISRTVDRRTGERKAQVLALTGQAGELLSRSVREARRLALAARARARGRGAQRKLAAIGRLGRYCTGAEGRISHLKRSYGLRRSRLKGAAGMRTWTVWSILAYNLDTLAIRTG